MKTDKKNKAAKAKQQTKESERNNQTPNQNHPKPKRQNKATHIIKSLDEYFQECIKNKTISIYTPLYLKEALEGAMKEYDFGIKHEKSALANFAEKYVIGGEPNMKPFEYFQVKIPQFK